MAQFRLQDLEIWKEAIEITDKLFDIADSLEGRKFFRFAEQLRGVALSISNNIAEGSGSGSKKYFQNFLNFSRRSTFETANILIVLQRRQLIPDLTLEEKLDSLERLCRRTTNFQGALSQ